jgi:ubiquitin carboxyl-terminal hydrolase 25
MQVLTSYKTAVSQKQTSLAHQINEKEQQVKTAFRDYNNIPYYLHAILIHEGTAESGHYYSFIYDRKQDLWWRFSDVNVSIEVEEVVFKEAFGGQIASLKTAYSLIYINEYCLK